jgi:hypothetical protein
MALISNVVTGGTIAATWGNAVRDATVQVTTSAARPGSPAEGMVIYETDTDLMLVYSGAAWRQVGSSAQANTFGAWTSFTPTLWQNATVTATLNRAVYMQIGKLVIGHVHFTSGGTGTTNSSGIQIRNTELPAPAYTTNPLSIGSGDYQLSGGNFLVLSVVQASATAFGFYRDGYSYTTGSSVGAGGISAIASGDKIRCHFMYEAA